ncbi:MAG: hypothetical protein ACXAE3_09095 [Candidatus Kariarchaeaceae archaeon]
MDTIRAVNGALWLILGVLIAIWLVFPLPLLETIIWIGFAIGCALLGFFEIRNSLISPETG